VGLDAHWLAAQSWVESRWKADAVSPSGAKGIAQFMPETWEEWGEGDPFDPVASIKAQASYVAYLVKQMDGSLWWATVCYCWGLGNVLHLLESGGTKYDVPAEFFGYACKVQQKAEDVRDMLESSPCERRCDG
jgi:membrane-bound lytic murein transglycosylase MltF